MLEEIINEQIANYEDDELYYLHLFDKEKGEMAVYYSSMAHEKKAKANALKDLKIYLKERGLL